jgi:hypothetical protein
VSVIACRIYANGARRTHKPFTGTSKVETMEWLPPRTRNP